MYLRAKIKCSCGCSFSIDNSVDGDHVIECPNCGMQITDIQAQNINSVLGCARKIDLSTADGISVTFKN